MDLAAVIELPDEPAARSEEARIKRLPRAEKLALVHLHAPAPGPEVGRRRQAHLKGS